MDPVLELQGAIVALLRANAGVTALVGQRTYDIPPQTNGQVTAALPYISIGPSSFQAELVDCVEGGEVVIQIDAWSVYPGQTEVRQIADAVRAAFRDHEFELTINPVVMLDHWRTDYLVSGSIKHASVRFTGYVEQP